MLQLLRNINFLKQAKLYDYAIAKDWSDTLNQIKEYGLAVVRLFDEGEPELADVENKSMELLGTITQTDGLNSFLAVGRLKSPEIRMQSTQLIQSLLLPRLYSFINDAGYECISGIHLLKPQGKEGILNPHQDSSMVDEAEYDSFYFWMPITNTMASDGTLEIIPYSHRLQIPFRSLNVPWTLSALEKELWQFTQKVVVPKGCAVIFSSRLIHASGENKNRTVRVAVNSFIKPAEAPLLHYYTDESSNFQQIDAYMVSPDFLYEEDITAQPDSSKYKLYKSEPNINRNYSINDLKNIFNG